MKEDFSKYTRKELARYIVMNQYARGLVSFKNIGFQIKVRLNGGFGVKPMTKAELIKGCEAMAK